MSKRAWIFIGLVCIAFGVIVAILVGKIIDERHERVLAKSFLLSSPEVRDRFGTPMTVSYKSDGASVAFHHDRNEGKYRFEVLGSRQSGTVRVQWSSKDAGEDFSVEKIELLQESRKPELVWQKGQ